MAACASPLSSEPPLAPCDVRHGKWSHLATQRGLPGTDRRVHTHCGVVAIIAAGAIWRPHCKAIRSPSIAKMLVDGGAVGITCEFIYNPTARALPTIVPLRPTGRVLIFAPGTIRRVWTEPRRALTYPAKTWQVRRFPRPPRW